MISKTISELSIRTQVFWHRQIRKSRLSPFLKYARGKRFTIGNVGDILSAFVFQHLSGLHPVFCPDSNPQGLDNFMVIGSILQFADSQTIVWGSGFTSPDLVFGNLEWSDLTKPQQLKCLPKKVCAVRGPLTLERIQELGIDTRSIALGDPACLMPLLYNPPPPPKRFQLGVIPHFSQIKMTELSNLLADEQSKFISVFTKPKQFIDTILQCELIATSSLHGLILADAYKIPAVWIRPKSLEALPSFKFQDYLLSINASNREPFIIDHSTKAKDVLLAPNYSFTMIDLNALLNSCPFLAPSALVDRKIIVQDNK